MKIFDLSLKLNGYKIDKAKQTLYEIQQISEADFKAYLDQRRQAIIAYHLKNNKFYQDLTKGIDMSDWNHIPVLTKRHLQKPLADRLSNGFNLKNTYVNKTSGSSGDPFVFAKDKTCHALTWAVIQNRFGWFNLDFNTSRQARFYGIPLNKKGLIKERFKDVLGNRHRFSVFELSDKTFEKCLQKFKKIHFEYINGYTSAIVQFAKFLKAKKVVLKDVCKTLKACVVTSEMLFEEDKNLMENQFGVPVINEYGASELDLIAFQNPNGLWQVNSETLFVEILDENNNILPYGEEGRVVITSLYNKAHPFIRYDIGDIGALSEKSTLKTPLLKKLTGRTNDIVYLPSGKKAAGLTFYYITKSIIEDDGNVKEFVIEQFSKTQFLIKYVSAKNLSKDKIKSIEKEMMAYLEKGLDITFERLPKIERNKSGKLKQFISHLKKIK